MLRKLKILAIMVFVLAISAGAARAMENRISVYVHDNGETSIHVAEARTVGGLLNEIGLQLGPYDTINPALDYQFGETVEHHIEITRGFSVTVYLGGSAEVIEVPSGMRVGFLLKRLSEERGVEYIYEGSLHEEIQPGQVIQLDTAQTEHIVEYELLPFETEQIMTDDILEGQIEIVREGREGLREIVYNQVSVNGVVRSRELISDSVTALPESRLIYIGTGRLSLAEQQPEPVAQSEPGQGLQEGWQATQPPSDAPIVTNEDVQNAYPAESVDNTVNTETAEPLESIEYAEPEIPVENTAPAENVEYIEIYSSLDVPEQVAEPEPEEEVFDPDAPPKNYKTKMAMHATAYTADYASTGKSPGHPLFGVTASGMKARYGVVAVDPNVIPLGTNLYIYGYGYCIAGDTGSAIKGNRIDLYLNTSEECIRYGHREIEVYILD